MLFYVENQDHLWAYTFVKDNWWKCDDLSITKTNEDVVKNQDAAIIFFMKFKVGNQLKSYGGLKINFFNQILNFKMNSRG